MRGRKPKPRSEAELLDFPGQRPEKKLPPKEKVEKQEFLKDGAAEIWDEVAPRVVGLRREHVAMLADYCRTVDQIERTYRMVEREGVITEGAKGPRKNPRLQILREFRAHALKLAAEFGLTPSSATRIGIPVEAESRDSDELLNGNWKNSRE